ncbi:Phage protein [Alloactinosynnema sp. L-07]|uniref:DUF7341 domain-containing protein n=1 Tax=Alloactinosynnema sp. L-07 TaxID=1653480 RepID=UPI00065EF8A6|nr:hypothetical protein [Alloactinosynnema sp. L-07]CRK55456.1 Phage protein [Alloactinosynnema sp. L-07]
MTRTLHRLDLDDGYGVHDRLVEDQAVPATMPPVDPVAARLAFDAAVDQLTSPGVGTITRESGAVERAVAPCLLDQLVEATRPGGDRGGAGGGTTGSRPPAALNALAVVADIGTEMRSALAALGHNVFGPGPRTRLSTQVHTWASHAEHWQLHDVDYLAYAATRAQHWADAARAVLDPPPRYRLRGNACPVCRETTVLVWSTEEADWVRQAALFIDPDRAEAVCAACDTRWGLDTWTHLGALIAQQQKEVLAIDCE